MGAAGSPVFVSETRNMHQYRLNLMPLENTDGFDLVQDRGNERKVFESCRVQGFELRILRENAIKLKLDICGDWPPVVFPYSETTIPETGERFSGDNVCFKINGKTYTNIYGLTLLSRKEGGIKTEIWIKRSLEKGPDLPEVIDELSITAQLLREKYELRHFGTLTITLNRMILTTDGTSINSTGAVIGPLRYYVAGGVQAEIYTSGGEWLK
jgi:hypothetical protein